MIWWLLCILVSEIDCSLETLNATLKPSDTSLEALNTTSKLFNSTPTTIATTYKELELITTLQAFVDSVEVTTKDRSQPKPTTASFGKSMKEDPAATCAHFLSAEPQIFNRINSPFKCTHSGVIFDELTRFIVEEYDTCVTYKSQEKQSKILYCSIVINHHMCLQAVGSDLDIETMPTYSAVARTVKELCFLNKTLPRKCLFERLRNVEDCVIEDVKSLLEMENKKWQYGAINVCSHFEIKKLCMWEELRPCQDQMASLMASFIGVLMKPPACTYTVSSAVFSFSFVWPISIILTAAYLIALYS